MSKVSKTTNDKNYKRQNLKVIFVKSQTHKYKKCQMRTMSKETNVISDKCQMSKITSDICCKCKKWQIPKVKNCDNCKNFKCEKSQLSKTTNVKSDTLKAYTWNSYISKSWRNWSLWLNTKTRIVNVICASSYISV